LKAIFFSPLPHVQNRNGHEKPILIPQLFYIETIDKKLGGLGRKLYETTNPSTATEKRMIQQKLKAQGIFLDLDGTIVDSKGAYWEAAKIACESLGQKAPELNAALEIPRRLEQGLAITDITNCETKKFLKVYLKAYYSATQQKTKLIPDIAETLENLSTKAKLAVITMRHVNKQIVEKELRYFGVLKYFSHVVTALDTEKPKPSPQALIKCADVLNLDLRNCVIAGDSVNDIRAGKAAGATTIGVLSGLFYVEELTKENPDLILKDINMLPSFIE